MFQRVNPPKVLPLQMQVNFRQHFQPHPQPFLSPTFLSCLSKDLPVRSSSSRCLRGLLWSTSHQQEESRREHFSCLDNSCFQNVLIWLRSSQLIDPSLEQCACRHPTDETPIILFSSLWEFGFRGVPVMLSCACVQPQSYAFDLISFTLPCF